MTGTVVTFYSYKGGVGRSFTLANVAVLLARWGYRVLAIDWDLEAPGLQHYFRPLLPKTPTGGVVDLAADFLAGAERPGRHAVRLELAGGEVSLLAAGKQDVHYTSRVQDIDWEDLYRRGFADFLEVCRAEWTENHDFVLIDSRTGISDIGGICTAHLPDKLVVLFTANQQSVEGVVDIAQRADIARDRMPYDRPPHLVLPVLSRLDNRVEYERAEAWQQRCAEVASPLYRNWLAKSVTQDLMLRHTTVPYVSYWSFGEQLPVLSEKTPSADQIGFALETVAAVIACRLDRTDLLAENRDAYVAAVRASRQQFKHELRVSTPRTAFGTATELVSELEKRDVRAVKSLSGDRSLLARTDDDARHLCLVVDGKVSRWQAAEVELFLHRTLGQDRRVIPILTAGTEAAALPGYVGNLRYLRLSASRGPAEVARDLVGQLKGFAPLVDTDEDLDLVAMLGQARGARLRPSRWDLVDELVTTLQTAVGAGDSDRTRDLATELAVVVKPRTPNGDDHHAAPPRVRQSIDWLLRTLDARAQTTTKPNHRKDLG